MLTTIFCTLSLVHDLIIGLYPSSSGGVRMSEPRRNIIKVVIRACEGGIECTNGIETSQKPSSGFLLHVREVAEVQTVVVCGLFIVVCHKAE